MSPLRSTLTQKGSRLLKGKRIALRPKPLTAKPPPEPVPFELQWMSSWELKLYYALKRRAITFSAQVSFEGGRGILGGMAVDFILPDYNMVIRVMGPWHNFPEARSRDEMQRVYLSGRGFTVIDLWEQDLENLDQVLAQKLGTPIRG